MLRTAKDLPAEQAALAYRGLWRVGSGFRTLKAPLALRPAYHSSEPGIRAPVRACVLAYTLMLVLNDRLDVAGMDLNAHTALERIDGIQCATVTLGEYRLECTSSREDGQAGIFEVLKAPPKPARDPRHFYSGMPWGPRPARCPRNLRLWPDFQNVRELVGLSG